MARILSEIIGHRTSLRQIESGLSAGRFPPTSLFVGPSGVGKLKTAVGVAQALICPQEVLACGVCPDCLRVEQRQSEHLLIIEPSSTQLKIDQAREATQFVNLQRLGQARAVIIDGAERLNPAAANSLLKTLEEPPEGSFFILISTSWAGMLQTIRSRSQTVRFSPLAFEHLQKLGDFADWAIQSSGGSVERAEILSQSGDLQKVRSNAFELLRSACAGRAIFGEVKDLVKDKESALFLAQTLQRWVRDLFRMQMGSQELLNPDQVEWSREMVQRWDSRFLDGLWLAVQRLEQDINGNIDRQLSFENFFLSCRPTS